MTSPLFVLQVSGHGGSLRVSCGIGRLAAEKPLFIYIVLHVREGVFPNADGGVKLRGEISGVFHV